MRRPRHHAPGLLLAVAVLAASGCSTKKTLAPDLAPETVLFVQGKLDTVNHVARLFWSGSDTDGNVVGFEFRFRRLDPPADSSWHYTTLTDSSFTVWSPTGHTMPIFDVRAVDDAGVRDPSPASADFSFSNQPPVVVFTDAPAPSDTTFPATTVTWKVVDIDGDPSKASFRLWLDGGAANPLIVTGKTFTVPPPAFLQGGVYYTGPRTLYIQAIDDGGLAGNVDSTSWIVLAPAEGATHARLLMLDDVATNDAVDVTLDTLYNNVATRDLPAGSFTMLHLKTTKAFRSQQDLTYAFSLFDAVTWTRGTTFFPIRNPDYLALYQDGVAQYVESGGQVLLEGSYLVANTTSAGVTTGALRPDLIAQLIGVEPLQHEVSGRPGEFSYEWGFKNNAPVRSSMFGLAFNCKPSAAVSIYPVSDTTQVTMWALPGTVTNDGSLPPPLPSRPFGATVPNSGGGRFTILGCSLFALDRPGVTSAPALLDQIFRQFGITGPGPSRARLSRR